MIQLNINNLPAVIESHFNNVVKKSGAKGRAKTIIQLIDKILDEKRRGRTSTRILFLRQLRVDIGTDYRNSLITASPRQLQEYALRYETQFGRLLAKKEFLKELKELFFYDSYEKWKAYDLATALDVRVCPYCNRQYTFTTEEKGTRPQFDHFFSREFYPYLSLSFYNLIPSCYICNSNLKHREKFAVDTHVHPYVEGFGSTANFSIKPKDIGFITGKESSFEVVLRLNRDVPIDRATIVRINSNKRIFRMKDLYNQHKDYVGDLIRKAVVYDDDYCQELYEKYQGTLFNSLADVKAMILSNYVEEDKLGRRVLSKLTRDVGIELGIL